MLRYFRFTIFPISYLVKNVEPTIPNELLDRMAETFRMLADPTRLAILRALL